MLIRKFHPISTVIHHFFFNKIQASLFDTFTNFLESNESSVQQQELMGKFDRTKIMVLVEKMDTYMIKKKE